MNKGPRTHRKAQKKGDGHSVKPKQLIACATAFFNVLAVLLKHLWK